MRPTSVFVPSNLLVKCPEELPDANAGDRESIQLNRKEHQRIYFDCAIPHNRLVDSLLRQGVSVVEAPTD